ncbi:MAG: permease-like cell division protein FtsX [Firmicutes bacterium]|nr:permease-like cell division protein FtsX [Bacillota bacterium]
MGSLGYNLKQAFQQIGRNLGMSVASILAITAMMLILGIFFVTMVNINLFTEMIKSNYDEMEVFLEDEVTGNQTNLLMNTVKKIDGVRSAEYRTKEEALSILKTRWGEKGYLLDSLGNNPLPNSIVIEVDSLETADQVNAALQELEGIEDIRYYKETVDNLIKVSGFLQKAMLVLMAFLVIVSIIVVSNTIKLTVVARSREISIMKYIGATNWFIRGPFLLEGIIIGTISSLLAAGITYLLYSKLVDFAGKQIMLILSSPLVPAIYLAVNIVIIFLAIGVGIGGAGSVISMRKYLNK